MIERFRKDAGSPVMQGIDEPEALLFGDPVPTTVTLPAELGGDVRRVVDAFVAPCPVTGIRCRHLQLEGDFRGQTLFVADSSQFFWYAR